MCLLKSYSPYDNVRKTDFTISKFCAKHPDFHPPPPELRLGCRSKQPAMSPETRIRSLVVLLFCK